MKQKYNKNNPASSHRAAPRRKRESVRPPPGSFFYLQAVCTTHNGTTETQLRTINSANQQPTNRKKRRLATRPKHQHRQHYRMQPRRAPRRWANHRTCGTSLSGARRPGEMRYFQISPARAPVRSIHHHCNHAPALWQSGSQLTDVSSSEHELSSSRYWPPLAPTTGVSGDDGGAPGPADPRTGAAQWPAAAITGERAGRPHRTLRAAGCIS
eukprot:scaffold8850_cov134-Isochrysis_galbana.AAC.12